MQKTEKVDLKKATHQVGMNNVVKCYKDFFGYFNALKTHCVNVIHFSSITEWPQNYKFEVPCGSLCNMRPIAL